MILTGTVYEITSYSSDRFVYRLNAGSDYRFTVKRLNSGPGTHSCTHQQQVVPLIRSQKSWDKEKETKEKETHVLNR